MAQAMTAGRLARYARAPRAGGVIGVLRTYVAAQGAAIRTADASFGHLQPDERDLETLGIEHTAAYSALVRH
jgi:hypothetical protein